MSEVIKKSLLASLAICLIGALDWFTGTEIFFSLFYLLPLSWLALQKNISWLVLFVNSIFASIVWLIAELFLIQEPISLFILYWNAFIGLASFIFIPFLLFYLQKKQREQSEINNKIKENKEQFELQKKVLNDNNNRLNDLNMELEMLASVASKTDNAVIIMDKNATVEWVNESFKRIYKIDSTEFNKRYENNFFDFVSEEDSTNNSIKQCITTKQTTIFESSRITSDNQKLYYQTTLSPILTANGDVEKLIGIVSDISKLKQAELTLQEQNTIINYKNQQITDSIFYAQNIQTAILPSINKLQNFFKDIFIFFKPRDIVSGDFYWFYEFEGKAFLAVVDCTGHGVPGALMSMIGNSILNDIIIINKIHSPAKILEELNTRVINTFSLNRGQEISNDDGMDISLCCIDKINNTISISSACHTVYIVKNNQLEKFEGDNYLIGSNLIISHNEPFKETLVKIDQPLRMYLSTDGFHDQFGGNDNIKYMQTRFTDFLFSIYKKPFEQQFNSIHTEFTQWKGNYKQIDDILIIGVYLEP